MHQLVGADRNGPVDALQGYRRRRRAAAARPARRRAAAAAARSDSISCGCQASFASAMSRACGTASRTAASRSASPVAAELELEQGIARPPRAPSPPSPRAMPSEIVKAVEHGMERRRAQQRRGAPARRFASRSHNAQSSALRAAPAGSSAASSARLKPLATARRKPRSPRPRPPRSRRSAHKARIRRAPYARRRSIVATTTTASCFEPREMVKPPLIGQRSTADRELETARRRRWPSSSPAPDPP